ncbi:hypothetical protein QJQ45_002676 [Haematococcus lacustris]|nr:hypothetical protein QJQ45_002676 [Haematococcus lacustris]
MQSRRTCRLSVWQRVPLHVPRVVLRAPRALLPDSIDQPLMAATLLASGVSIVSLALRFEPLPDAEAADGSSYAVMGVVSCIPLVSWTAWLLPCILEPARSRLYLTWAALYAAPFLRDGFDLTGYSMAMLALGALHIQVARLAATEPAILKRLVGGLQLPSPASAAEKQGKVRWEAADLDPDELLEMQQFDRQLLERDRRRRKGS